MYLHKKRVVYKTSPFPFTFSAPVMLNLFQHLLQWQKRVLFLLKFMWLCRKMAAV